MLIDFEFSLGLQIRADIGRAGLDDVADKVITDAFARCRWFNVQVGRPARDDTFDGFSGHAGNTFDIDRMKPDLFPLQNADTNGIEMNEGLESRDQSFQNIR